MKETCLSHQTIGRRINDFGEDIEGNGKTTYLRAIITV